MTADEERQAYERGRTEGEIRERLAIHDKHFETLNGQLAAVAARLNEMTTAITRVGDKQQAIIDTNVATRDALRAASAQRWSRWQRLFTVVSVLAAIIGAYVAWRTLH